MHSKKRPTYSRARFELKKAPHVFDRLLKPSGFSADESERLCILELLEINGLIPKKDKNNE